jgi:gluconokinase
MRHDGDLKLVVMGVAGAGKSTLGARLAQSIKARLIEGDDHHLPSSEGKMRRGIALDDRDREPWLDRLALLMSSCEGPVVLTCSALKKSYRDRLRARVPCLRFLYIDIAPGDAIERVSRRQGHSFPATLVSSQFETLEPPLAEPGVLCVAAERSVAEQVDAALRWLDTSASALIKPM